jgi:hypothetical protein
MLDAVRVLRFSQSSSAASGAIEHSSFLHGSILFLVATIATACYVWLNPEALLLRL